MNMAVLSQSPTDMQWQSPAEVKQGDTCLSVSALFTVNERPVHHLFSVTSFAF